MGRLTISQTPLEGVSIVETDAFVDARGRFARWFCADELSPVLNGRRIAQINHSSTLHVGTVRGLHYQNAPHGEMKLVRCIRGRVWDMALDLRAGSPGFLKSFGIELTPENGRMLVIPEGFAHGFQSLEDNSEILYLNTAFYTPQSEDGVHCMDPRADLKWPLPPVHLSARDSAFPFLPGTFKGIK
jgi:dTDP-4-dehydrorhamnose 3,5-epimerase